MAVVKLSTAGLTNYAKYSSMLAGNAPFVASAYDLLETTTLSSSASSVTFSSLDTLAAGYAHLQIRSVTKGAANNFGNSRIGITFNGDTTGYSRHTLQGDGSSVVSQAAANSNRVDVSDATAESNASYAGVFGASIVDILDFSNTSKNTTVRSLSGSIMQNKAVTLNSGAWLDLAAVTSINLEAGNGDFVAGCRFSIYGVK